MRLASVCLFALVLFEAVGACNGKNDGQDGTTGDSDVTDGTSEGSSADAATDADAGSGGNGGDAGDGFSCGPVNCNAAKEYCRIDIPGTAGASGHGCVDRGGCDTCACLTGIATCTCDRSPSGFITVSCRSQ